MRGAPNRRKFRLSRLRLGSKTPKLRAETLARRPICTNVQTREGACRLLTKNYAIAHERILKVAEDLSEEQFGRRLSPAVHSIAWQVWHIARWDDRFAEILLEKLPELAETHGPPRQVWNVESLGEAWDLPVGAMGRRDTGTLMEDDAADQVTLPGKVQVLDYARRVFTFVDEVASSLTDDVLFVPTPEDPDQDTFGQNLMYWLDHANRHLGMIEAMKGLQGLKGTATE